MSRKGQTPWDRDPLILDRLAQHERLRQAGQASAAICAAQGISAVTYHADQKRLAVLAQRHCAQEVMALRVEADTWLRQCIRDADRLTSEAATSRDQAAHQANKRAAVEAFIKLHGLARPEPEKPAPPAVEIHIAPSFLAAMGLLWGMPEAAVPGPPVITVASNLLPEGGTEAGG